MLDGLRVVELASDRAAYAGKLLGDLGADVIVVEPPGGHASQPIRTLRRRQARSGREAVVVVLQHLQTFRSARPFRAARCGRFPTARC